ncbi:FAD-dependent oxidoreductase [Altericista sp. CCNU0014]|uniref:FAD-dependent oxidoreductase n=1 Tax=Altericista sp. CCNU0014 TaxID=3082949 RepID=UPI003850FB47
MRIAIIGGGASGLVTAYLLDKQGHRVTVFEQQPILGGHIRTLNKNVKPDRPACQEILEGGVLEFPTAFRSFLALMKELEVELEPVQVGSALFLRDGRHFLSANAIQKNFTGMQRAIEYLRLDTLYARSAAFWVKMQFPKIQDFYNQPLSQHLKGEGIRNCWLKLLTMYSYSMPFERLDNFPAELAIPALREYVFSDWVRVKGGVYSYVEKILERFKGDIWLDVEIANVSRTTYATNVQFLDGVTQTFDKVVFATPPDRVMQLLSDPTPSETKRFSPWQANYQKTVLHTDTSMYDRHGIRECSEFDFFQTDREWGYNAYLNHLCGIESPVKYSLAFHLEELLAKDKIVQVFEHHTPLYTVESFRYRDEVARTNGENNTYHAGAYLGDGLHEGAIASAMEVARLIG